MQKARKISTSAIQLMYLSWRQQQFVKDQPLPEVRARLEESGIHSVVFQTAGNRSDQGDYITVMEKNLLRLATTLFQTAQ